jgi:chemotaxis protein MotB
MGRYSGSESGGGGHEATGMMRWLLTYADVITLLLIVFVMMFAFSQLSLSKFQQASQSLNEVFGNVESISGKGLLKGIKEQNPNLKAEILKIKKLAKMFGVPRADIQQVTNLKSSMQKAFQGQESANINMSINERGLVISFSGQVLFEKAKADIKPSMVPILEKVGKVIKDIDNFVRIEGFTDNLPIKTDRFPSNWELSTARATAVLRFFVENMKFRPDKLSAAGYGEYKPNYPNNSEKNRALNRKVDIVILYSSLSKQEPK